MRRIKSPRASVYLEFAIVMPIVAMVIAFIFEFVSIWDARCMANHAAWVCGRIASVNVGAGEYKSNTSVNDLWTEDMDTATMFLMSTCSMGGMGARVGKDSPDFDKAKITTVIEKPYTAIQKCFSVNWGQLIHNVVDNVFPECPDILKEMSLIAYLRDWIVGKLTTVITAILSPLTTLLDQATESAIFKDATDIGTLTGALGTTKRLWQLDAAEKRMNKYGHDRILEIVQRDGVDDQFHFALGSTTENKIDLPQQVVNGASGLPNQQGGNGTTKKWVINTAYGWPWYGQHQRMIDVKIHWPFERAWLWQALAFKEQNVSDTSCLAAQGRAIVYPQPIIKNKDLDSDNPTAFSFQTNAAAEVVGQLQAEYNNFLKTVWFWYKYRMHKECVYDYDTDVDGSLGVNRTGTSSYHFLSGGRIPNDGTNIHNLSDQDAAYSNWDGLYNWMTSVLGDDIESELRSFGNQTKEALDLLHGKGQDSLSLKIWKRFCEEKTEEIVEVKTNRFPWSKKIIRVVTNRTTSTTHPYQSKSYLKSFNQFCKGERNALTPYYFRSGGSAADTMKKYFTDDGYRYGYQYRSRNWFYWDINYLVEPTSCLYRYDHFTTDDLTGNAWGLRWKTLTEKDNEGCGYFEGRNANYYKLRKWNLEGSKVETTEETTASGIVFMIYLSPSSDGKVVNFWDSNQITCLWPFSVEDPAMVKVKEAIISEIAASAAYQAWCEEASEYLMQELQPDKGNDKDYYDFIDTDAINKKGTYSWWFKEKFNGKGHWKTKTEVEKKKKDDTKNKIWRTTKEIATKKSYRSLKLYQYQKFKNNSTEDNWKWSYTQPADEKNGKWIVADHTRGKISDGFSLEAFANDLVEYYIGTMFKGANNPYRIGARWLIKRTADQETNANTYMENEWGAYLRLTFDEYGTNNAYVKYHEAASTNMIAKCSEQLGKNLQMEGGDSSDVIDIDAMSSSNPLPEDIQTKLKDMDDPEKIKELVKPYFDAQKANVWTKLLAVNAAEKALIEFNAEQKFKDIRDERLTTLYKWIAQEILVHYGTKHSTWKYNGNEYNISAFLPTSVARDNRFKAQTDAFHQLANDWNGKLDALTAADEELGKAIGLECVTDKTNYDNQPVNPDGSIASPDANTPTEASTESGSDDDKRGSDWTFKSDSKRWVPTAGKGNGW